MKKQINLDKKSTLRGKERVPFEKIKAKFTALSWDASIEFGNDYGWYILATKNSPSGSTELRRIKPFKIIGCKDLFSAIKLQQKMKNDLIEILPYKIHKGDRIFLPEISDDMDFMSEAKFLLFRKFFPTAQFSLKGMDKSEANKNDSV